MRNKKMRRLLIAMVCGLLIAAAAITMVACDPKDTDTINVYSREEGSGTRSAFIELTGVEEDDKDRTYDKATILDGTNKVLTAVAGDKRGIGYVSYGSLNDKVKAISVDGVAPSVDAIKSGDYKLSRPFNIAYKQATIDGNALAADFLNFLFSAEAQEVIAEENYITDDAVEHKPYAKSQGIEAAEGITVGGSSSVSPLMEKLIATYETLSGVSDKIELMTSDSTSGMNNAISGTYDIGMASREVKDSEIDAGLTAQVIAIDGIAVIVNPDNAVSALTSEQIKNIFIGAVTSWKDIA